MVLPLYEPHAGTKVHIHISHSCKECCAVGQDEACGGTGVVCSVNEPCPHFPAAERVGNERAPNINGHTYRVHLGKPFSARHGPYQGALVRCIWLKRSEIMAVDPAGALAEDTPGAEKGGR